MKVPDIDAQKITIRIDDPELAMLHVWYRVSKFARVNALEEVDVKSLPGDVVQGCLSIERNFKRGEAR